MSGRVIKTLTGIRFRRSVSTPCVTEKDTTTEIRKSKDQNKAYEPYVPENLVCADDGFAPVQRLRRIRVTEESIEATKPLIEWFVAEKDNLPITPFQLAPGQWVPNPPAFYETFLRDVLLYPRVARASALKGDLRNLYNLFGPQQASLASLAVNSA